VTWGRLAGGDGGECGEGRCARESDLISVCILDATRWGRVWSLMSSAFTKFWQRRIVTSHVTVPFQVILFDLMGNTLRALRCGRSWNWIKPHHNCSVHSSMTITPEASCSDHWNAVFRGRHIRADCVHSFANNRAAVQFGFDDVRCVARPDIMAAPAWCISMGGLCFRS